MKTLSITIQQRKTLTTILFDLIALAFIFLVPTISHLISLPIFLIEPMRLMIVLALVHTKKKNVYILALTLPLFSFLISGHPEFPKMLLIVSELTLNILLFYLLVNKIKSFLLSIFLSIIISKIFYYVVKFCLINLVILNTDLIATPIYMQLITTVVYGLYIYKFYKKK